MRIDSLIFVLEDLYLDGITHSLDRVKYKIPYYLLSLHKIGIKYVLVTRIFLDDMFTHTHSIVHDSVPTSLLLYFIPFDGSKLPCEE